MAGGRSPPPSGSHRVSPKTESARLALRGLRRRGSSRKERRLFTRLLNGDTRRDVKVTTKAMGRKTPRGVSAASASGRAAYQGQVPAETTSRETSENAAHARRRPAAS